MTTLDIALSYLDKGLSVIPLFSKEMLKKNPPQRFREELQREKEKNERSDDPLPKEKIIEKFVINKCKIPCIFGWKDFQKRLPTREEVTGWFTEHPDANIAIITGAVSNLVVFDIDSPAALEFVQEIGGLPESLVMVKTGKGNHIYVLHPGFPVANQVNTKRGLDIRGDGGYVAAPPSIHGSGRQYEWVDGSSIFDLDPPPCTSWMVDYLKNIPKDDPAPDKTKDKKQTETLPVKTETIQSKPQETNPDEYLILLQNGCNQGGRNHASTKLIGHLLKTGMKEPEVWAMIQIWNKDKVKPPLDVNELKKTFDSVKALEKKNQTTPPKIEINSFLDDVNGTINKFKQNYLRIPFANNNLTNLEKQMNGGFAGGCFYLFGGIPSAGKTVLLNNIADNMCVNGYPVLFFSYDDGRTELQYRTLSRFSKKSIEGFNSRTHTDIASVCQLPIIKQILPLKYVVERNIPVDKWQDLIDKIKQKHGKAPVIIIDYLRKLKTEKGNSDERLRVDDILSRLTEIAKTNNTPVIAISELARDSYRSGQRLSMASFKESGTIEYEASWLGIMAAVEEKDGVYTLKDNWDRIIEHDGNVDLIVFKAKKGTGTTGRISLKVDKELMTVKDRPVEAAVIKQKKISQFA